MFRTKINLLLPLIFFTFVNLASGYQNDTDLPFDGSSVGVDFGTGIMQLLDDDFIDGEENFKQLLKNFQLPGNSTGLRGIASMNQKGEWMSNNESSTDEYARSLQQATNVRIVNNCAYDVYSFAIYRSGNNKVNYWSWPRINKGSTLLINGLTNSRMFMYGLRVGDMQPVWRANTNAYFLCWGPTNCFRTLELGALNGGTIRYQMCGGTSTPPITGAPPQPSSGSLASQWLSEHNSRRTQYFRDNGLSPLNLKWANSIAQSAENYANKLTQRSGCSIAHGHNGDRYGGENLSANWGGTTSLSPQQVLTGWYDREINLPSLDQKLHATQIVFRSSRYLGCGQAEKTMSNGQKCYIHVCRYISAGNCIADNSNWKASVLSPDAANRCGGDRCNGMPEGCF